ncbi:MAG: PorV/PorQ family protein [Elusimicrobia bacterium]|nr:PorV/PorQ family protein [Elusimicrobiota bacterium]
MKAISGQPRHAARLLDRRSRCRAVAFAVSSTILLVFSLAVTPPARAAFKRRDTGGNAAQFLKLGADARAAAMGGAVRALSEDATAVYWNPAGLSALRLRHASFSHGAMYQGVFYDFFAYAQPIESIIGRGRPRELRESQLGALGVAFFYMNAGSLQETDNTGATTGGSFMPQEFAGALAWGGRLTPDFDLGVGMKYIYSKLYESAQTAAGDLGARLRLRVVGMPLTLSAGVHNFGGSLRYGRENQDLPFFVSAGANLRVLKNLTLTGDVIAPRDNRVYGAGGIELRQALTSKTGFSLRAGYNGMNDYKDLQGLTGVGFGCGLRTHRVDMDYAWTPFGVLTIGHRFSLSYRF